MVSTSAHQTPLYPKSGSDVFDLAPAPNREGERKATFVVYQMRSQPASKYLIS